ncbi:MAG: 1-deoxy-D-xylulose-5-phosphate reductoisomerase [Negativicutes bacterium]|nr:1-deoxy-D-xylulose-5-phosphate reductoisomerase [Negativicutes bacterium]
MKSVVVLGSTGSIGTQTLEVIACAPERFRVAALAAHSNDVLLEEQIRQYRPEIAVLVDPDAADRLARRYRGRTVLLSGEEGLLAAAAYANADIVLSAIVGFAGLRAALAALAAGKDLALANKETLVAAGQIVTALAREKQCRILPVDSEHSAILQCLQGEKRSQVKKIILTASGGPFRGFTSDRLRSVTLEECLQHPNWRMGRKITVDSATLVNKGLEVIEARWLFDIDYHQIDVLVHPQSIIHSMVEFDDGAVIAQLGLPDMRIPIQYALTYPDRIASPAPRLSFNDISALTFEVPDHQTFLGLPLAYAAGKTGGTLPCVYNAANEVAVNAFLSGKIGFLDIYHVIETTMGRHQVALQPDLEALVTADAWARETAARYIDAC